MVTEEWKVLAQKARDIRDKSMNLVDKYFPLPEGFESGHLTGVLPDPLPLDVTSFPEKYLNPEDYKIVSMDPMQLLEALSTGKISSLRATAAYIRCAVLAQRTVNNVSEFLPEKAFQMATKADEYLKSTGKTLGQLHGLPFSLKDMVHLKDHVSNFSCCALVDNVMEYDCLAARIIEDEGAVFYQRTTQPQFLMHMETDSNIYGITVNPHNIKLSVGGSSGGEGASLAFGSSCVGLGTDIGGSIRGPAAMCGRNFDKQCKEASSGPAIGWKPTSNLLPVNDCYNPNAGAEAIAPAIGPLARTFEIGELVSRVMVDAKPWTTLPELSNKPWDADVYKGKKKLKIGVLDDDGVVRIQPPMKRALDELKAKLQKVGSIDGVEIEVVDWKPYKHDLAFSFQFLYFEDGLLKETNLLKQTGEPPVPLAKANIELIEEECNRASGGLGISQGLTINRLWELNTQKYNWRYEYLDLWKKSGCDILLCPSHAGTAQPHYGTTYVGYTLFLNMLDWPGLTFQVDKQDPAVDKKYEGEYEPRNEHDKGYYERYDPELFAGAPIALQIAAPRSRNEEVIEAFKILQKVL